MVVLVVCSANTARSFAHFHPYRTTANTARARGCNTWDAVSVAVRGTGRIPDRRAAVPVDE